MFSTRLLQKYLKNASPTIRVVSSSAALGKWEIITRLSQDLRIGLGLEPGATIWLGEWVSTSVRLPVRHRPGHKRVLMDSSRLKKDKRHPDAATYLYAVCLAN